MLIALPSLDGSQGAGSGRTDFRTLGKLEHSNFDMQHYQFSGPGVNHWWPAALQTLILFNREGIRSAQAAEHAAQPASLLVIADTYLQLAAGKPSRRGPAVHSIVDLCSY